MKKGKTQEERDDLCLFKTMEKDELRAVGQGEGIGWEKQSVNRHEGGEEKMTQGRGK